MAARLTVFEEFLARFNQLKEICGTPQRLINLVDQHKGMADAVAALFRCLRTTDLERRLQSGQKIFKQVPPAFGAAWADYERDWLPALSYISLRGAGLEPDSFAPGLGRNPDQLEPPDPRHDESFDPEWHDGGTAIELGVERLEIEARTEAVDDYTERAINSSRIALGAYDYLINTIGLDIQSVFRRWRDVPKFFLPAHVSNRYGASDKGSLPHLLDDAVRAYVFGAPAAAIAMCRAALEMVLKQHYLPEQENNSDLSDLIVLAERRYSFVQAAKIDPIRRTANRILHKYHMVNRLTEEDERTIVNFLKTVKFLIQRAPKL